MALKHIAPEDHTRFCFGPIQNYMALKLALVHIC